MCLMLRLVNRKNFTGSNHHISPSLMSLGLYIKPEPLDQFLTLQQIWAMRAYKIGVHLETSCHCAFLGCRMWEASCSLATVIPAVAPTTQGRKRTGLWPLFILPSSCFFILLWYWAWVDTEEKGERWKVKDFRKSRELLTWSFTPLIVVRPISGNF
jgi:hypothetical protein